MPATSTERAQKHRALKAAIREHPNLFPQFAGPPQEIIDAAAALQPIDPATVDDPARAVWEWAESHLIVPTGRLAGQPFRVPAWQRRFLRGALHPDCREAALSTARKNGKTGLIAMLLLSHLVGPVRFQRWRAIVVSLTGNHAGELKRQISEICESSGIMAVDIMATPTPGRIVGPFGEVQCLAADKASGHAVGCDMAIIDEAGLLDEGKRPMWEGVSTSRSGRDGRLICISVRGHSPMFGELLDRAGMDAHYVQRHEPAPSADPFDPETWAAANPGMESGIKSPDYMELESKKAAATAVALRGFRTWELNQPVNPVTEPLVDPSDWERIEAADLPDRGGVCYVGLDLGSSISLSAACAVWDTGRVEWYHGASSIPEPLERGRVDGCGDLYQRAFQRFGDG